MIIFDFLANTVPSWIACTYRLYSASWDDIEA